MKRNKHIILSQLDNRLSLFRKLDPTIPDKGWIYTIRKSIGMSMQQLALRMGVSRQNIDLLEKREAKGSITLNRLREMGSAMDMRLVYGFVSDHDSLEDMIEKRALELARRMVLRTNNTMVLEDQKVDDQMLQDNMNALAKEIKENMPKYIWDL